MTYITDIGIHHLCYQVPVEGRSYMDMTIDSPPNVRIMNPYCCKVFTCSADDTFYDTFPREKGGREATKGEGD